MVNEFMVCVDRILSSSAACFQESPPHPPPEAASTVNVSVVGEKQGDNKEAKVFSGEDCSSSSSAVCLRECRICQEEDDQKDMEAPCACNGTLKFAHRKCIQKWCNKKGDITCEICNQVFSPNYTIPPPKSNADVMTIDIRQSWNPHIDLRDPRFLAIAAAEQQFLQSEYEHYALANSGTLTCFRTVAVALMLILIVRQTLIITKDFGMLQESSHFFHISVLQLAGFLLPFYVVGRSWYIVQCRRRRSESNWPC
ncbi:uncharacterized protein LOC127252768 isoform X2 [Andrographis paniculata]|uniref:uncharacterized protein LOC127252768 isoform X2 n=1 Tax=Andrographis paniculata TaxID=175694 RepID=UPI0021E79A06|nr:uncharacterized protein LOC127252768 isoform X2 [Andrographis paniculata]